MNSRKNSSGIAALSLHIKKQHSRTRKTHGSKKRKRSTQRQNKSMILGNPKSKLTSYESQIQQTVKRLRIGQH